MPYDSPKRVDWHFIPKETRKGLQIRHMSEAQRKLAHDLLKTLLSEAGYGKATGIMGLENLLKDLEKTKTGTPLRDAERYYWTVFGDPAGKSAWGLSVEGHHLSLNFVIEGRKVISTTPTVFAVNPAIVMAEREGVAVKKGTRLLAEEEQLAFDLFAKLDGDQKKVALIAEKAPAEIRAAGAPQPPTDAPAGISAAKLNKDQQKLLIQLIEAHAKNLPEFVAAQRMTKIEKSGFDRVHFCWAGADKPGIGHYFRVQGPSFLIELVNTQPDAAGNPANHIHCVWRSQEGDFALPIGK